MRQRFGWPFIMLPNNKCLSRENGQWSIEARAFPIPYTPFTHNFWTLIDAKHCVIDQLHGLAVDPQTGQIHAIGNSSHVLQVIRRRDIVWSLQAGQPTAICTTGLQKEVQKRWQAAVNAIPAINALHLPYPDWWQHFYIANSNTVFNTLGLIMGFSELFCLLNT